MRSPTWFDVTDVQRQGVVRVCRDDEAARLMPPHLRSVREAIDEAMGNFDAGRLETAWSDAGAVPGDPGWAGRTMFLDRREIRIDAGATAVDRAVCRVGGAGVRPGSWYLTRQRYERHRENHGWTSVVAFDFLLAL